MKGGYPMRTSSLRSGFLMSTSITVSCDQKFVGTMCSSSNLGELIIIFDKMHHRNSRGHLRVIIIECI